MPPTKDVVRICSIDWDFIWQGHQEIMTTLAKQGNQVLFVENTGVRSPKFRDLPRLWQTIRNWWRGIKGFRQVLERRFAYSRLLLTCARQKALCRIAGCLLETVIDS